MKQQIRLVVITPGQSCIVTYITDSNVTVEFEHILVEDAEEIYRIMGLWKAFRKSPKFVRRICAFFAQHVKS